jgi:hypothetical protein
MTITIRSQLQASRQHRWTTELTSYHYTLAEQDRDGVSKEVIAFHWHPEPFQKVQHPHLHLGYGAGTLSHQLDKAHIPTNQISIADIVRFVISELGVTPLRSDWETVLAKRAAAG